MADAIVRKRQEHQAGYIVSCIIRKISKGLKSDLTAGIKVDAVILWSRCAEISPRLQVGKMIGRASALCLAIFASAITLAGCGNNVPSFLRTDDTPNYNIVGGEKLAVPANFVDSQSYGSMFVVASWPEM